MMIKFSSAWTKTLLGSILSKVILKKFNKKFVICINDFYVNAGDKEIDGFISFKFKGSKTDIQKIMERILE